MLQNIPNQIVQSPARLGLPNPNSPSLQNPTPSKFASQNQQTNQSHQQPLNHSTTPAVSSTLLPLLPPLPRAQSILSQMASLASKLFEVSPIRSHWIGAFRGSLPSFLSSQTQQSFGSSSPSSTKELLAQFGSLQVQILEAVAELQEILDLQDSRENLARDIGAKDSALLSFANKLKEAEHVLDVLVDDYSDYRRPKRTKAVQSNEDDSSTTTIANQLKLSDILSYAHKISYTNFAPPEFGSGQAPLRGALPPAPQDEQMRASQLYNFANLDVGLPKEDEGKEKIIEPLIEVQAPLPVESRPHDDISAMQGLIPPNIVVPSGWKPGMPVELPSDLPILPPPGWKPGDPITLPPLDSIPVPPRVEEQQNRPLPPPPVLGKAPEPIQVRHVQLDIEYDSSDYSSDEASSDSED